MCGRYACFVGARRLAEILDTPVDADILGPPRYNAAPTQAMPVLVADGGSAPWRLTRLTFGWPRGPGGRPPAVINARGETAHRLPLFRGSWAARRAVVIASGFFEWQAGPPPRQPWYFSPSDDPVWGLAGLWQGSAFVILTRPAGPSVAPVHPRMPHILPRAAWASFLTAAPPAIANLPATEGATEVAARRVGRDGLRPGHDDPDTLCEVSDVRG